MRIYQPYWIAFCKAKNIPLDNTCKMLNFIEWMEDKYHDFELINNIKRPFNTKEQKEFLGWLNDEK